MKTKEFKNEMIKSKIDYWVELGKRELGLDINKTSTDFILAGWYVGKIELSLSDIKDLEHDMVIKDNNLEVIFSSVSQDFNYKVTI